MTAVHVALIAGGYAVKAAVTFAVWRRFGPRVLALGRLARSRRSAGRPVLARATPGHLSRTFRLGPPTDRRATARPGTPPGTTRPTTARPEAARPYRTTTLLAPVARPGPTEAV